MIAVYKKFFLMLGVTVLLCLSASVVFSKDGKVYYCSGKNLVRIGDFKVTEYELQNFKFKRLEDSIKFGSEDDLLKDVILNKKNL